MSQTHQYPWYDYRPPVYKAVTKWLKRGISTSKHAKEELIYKYNGVLPSFPKASTLFWNNLTDTVVTSALEEIGALNWWNDGTRLHAVRIPNDQQSLCHSVSVSLWGIPDNKGFVNFLVKTTLKLHNKIWNTRLNQNPERHVKIEDLKASGGRALPEHIFILANILQRPIIVVSDEVNAVTQKHLKTFLGIYLPLMSKPVDCSKTPVFLAYYNASFYPLLIKGSIDETKGNLEEKYQISFPLLRNDFSTFPVQCLQAGDEINAGDILQDYLRVKESSFTIGDGSQGLLYTQSDCISLLENKNMILEYAKISMQLQQNEKTQIRRKLSFNSLRHLKKSSKSKTNNGVDPTEVAEIYLPQKDHVSQDRLSQHLHMPDSVERHSENAEPNAALDITVNHHEIVNAMGELPRSEPNAPEVYEEPLSMMNERCSSCNMYRSSTKTFPFCHECYKKCEENNKIGSNQTGNKNSLVFSEVKNGSISPTCDLPANKIEVMDADSVTDTETSTISSAKNVTDVNKVNNKDKEEKKSTKIPMAVCDLSVSNQPSNFDDKSFQVSNSSTLNRPNLKHGDPINCASPFCNETIFFPESLCQKCIKILSVHQNLSNSSETSCHNPAGESENEASANKCEGDLNRNKDGNTKTNFSSANLSKTQSHLEKEKKSVFNKDKHGFTKTELKKTISVPEDDKPKENNVNAVPQRSLSLMVTSATSVNDTKHLLDICSGIDEGIDVELPEMENMVKFERESAKYKTSLHSEVKDNNKSNSSNIHRNTEGKPKGYGQGMETSRNNELKPGDYKQTMQLMEYNFRKGARKCKKDSCSNYGSKEKNGFCNACYKAIHMNNVSDYHHSRFHLGIEQCDGVDSSSGEDEIDGRDMTVIANRNRNVNGSIVHSGSSSDESEFSSSELESN